MSMSTTAARRAKNAGTLTEKRAVQVATGASIDALRDAARSCRDCPLWVHATQTVFGEGPRRASVVLVGEQPGDQEDLEGKPFVGPAGRLLDKALTEVGIERSSLYV